jgi:nucleotide-binding universal stress UspA family protein
MKSILVPIGGSNTDAPLFETALAAARPYGSHLQFLHVRVGAGEAAVNMPHTGFAMGPALSNALKDFDTEAQARSVRAARHVHNFCARSMIEICDTPDRSQGVTASWHEESGYAFQKIMFHARHNDLVVVGRAKKLNGLPKDFIEQLLVGCGRPVLISNSTPPLSLTGTIMVCWKETAESARAVSAAMPFVTHAKRVIIASVAEHDQDLTGTMSDVARQFAWHGVHADTKIITPNGGSIPDLLSSAARACGADLVVMGAYGRSRLQEILFGGCTQSVIRNAERPVLMMH